jgi:hypothetical protein
VAAADGAAARNPAWYHSIAAHPVFPTKELRDQAVEKYHAIEGGQQTLIEHWNGASWEIVASPDLGTAGNVLFGVRAASPSSIWAVGSYSNTSGADKSLILRWNGRTWQQVASPSPGGSDDLHAVRADRGDAGSGNSLAGVAVTSGSDAWAVGSYLNDSDTAQNVLLLHWNGRAWKSMAGPAPAPRNALTAVAASSGSSIWAVGFSSTGAVRQALAFHCC